MVLVLVLVLAQYYKNKLITENEATALNPAELFDTVLNPHVKELQKKHSKSIFVNIDLFNEINLTNIDMIALQKEMPFPIVVPSFPLVTNLHQLDYGVKKN